MAPHPRFSARSALSAALALLCAGCTSLSVSPPVPKPAMLSASIPGFPGVRYGYDQTEADFIADYHSAMSAAQPDPKGVSVLALSGGGPNGAFGAGLLVGWTQRGDRPEFRVVTGVSTGALAAPFAFLGPAYDDRLVRAYTKTHDSDIFIPHLARSFFRLLRVEALTDTSPLHQMLAKLVDQPLVDAVAAEHRRGRRLYVCTHEIVTGRAVFWNLSAIAASGRPESLALFRKVLVASAAVPIAFPPQHFEVETPAGRFRETHVDGGLSRQVFLHLNGARSALRSPPEGPLTPLTAYIIRNGRTRLDYDAITPTLVPIALRTIEALISSEGVGDLHRIHAQTVAEQAAYRLAVIPDSFDLRHEGMFEPTYMRRLFDLGRERMLSGIAWQDSPPMSGTPQARPGSTLAPVAPAPPAPAPRANDQ
ncbi:MAG: patatin-like phospholipase family protein [Opitutaceae bacterium]|nr:patatin-like phospholipase family protein [Opitutaceae bacterium]